MDEGPFRMPRPAGRSADTQPAATSEPIDDPKAVAVLEEQKPVRRPITHHTSHVPKEEKSKKKLFTVITAVIVVILIGVSGWLLISGASSGTVAIDGSKYQAVFLPSGQVYFGKLQSANSEYMKLTDVYYLQAQSTETDAKNPQQTTTNQDSNVQLIKLGDEIHGPQDEMIISKDQILFYENLKSDGKVATSIQKFKDTKK